jgi:hypothetical protein
MSDPILPVSQPEPEGRRRKLSRKWMVSMSGHPFWQEAYFDASAGSSIQSLDKLRAALLEMSGKATQ